MGEFEGRVALIAGGSSLVGLALGRALLGRGARVWIGAAEDAAAQEAAQRLGLARDRGLGLPIDDPDAFRRAVAHIEGAGESVGMLFTVSTEAEVCAFEGATPAAVEAVLSSELLGAARGSHAVWPGMIAAGRGAIVHVFGVEGLAPFPGRAAHSAARQGLLGLAMALRVEGAPRGIEVMAACVGVGGSEAPRPSAGRWRGLSQPSRVMGALAAAPGLSPDDCADAILRGLRLGRSVVVAPRSLRLVWLARRLSPLGWLRLARF